MLLTLLSDVALLIGSDVQNFNSSNSFCFRGSGGFEPSLEHLFWEGPKHFLGNFWGTCFGRVQNMCFYIFVIGACMGDRAGINPDSHMDLPGHITVIPGTERQTLDPAGFKP